MASESPLFYGETVINPPRHITQLSSNRLVENYLQGDTKQIIKFSITNDKERLVIVPEMKIVFQIINKVGKLENIVRCILSDISVLGTYFSPMIRRRRVYNDHRDQLISINQTSTFGRQNSQANLEKAHGNS